jgi:probable F420-dependent oxidoreductase
VTAIGISLGTLNPKSWRDVALTADESGIDAVLVSDHLVAPALREGQLGIGDEASRMQPDTPLIDSLAYCAYLAGQTGRLHVGTYVYLLALRHPFVAARAAATLDLVSGGRLLFGVGAGWLTSEFDAMGIDPTTRGRRLDEAIAVCRRLWREERIEHDGEFFRFGAVGFAPKPPTPGGPPILIGGEFRAALRRAALLGDGWLGMRHTPRSAAERVSELQRLRQANGIGGPFSVTVGGEVRSRQDLADWAAAGIDRVVVRPWTHSRTARAELADFCSAVLADPDPR